ncbi:ATP-dependent DNA helicase PIF1-like [Lathyrus oleraceus]|uniref:ATP-dependent DNA helicase PIF1-like n=1 Tax=Pisum sativum TaxID=3888 RepID=UPI0021D20047|nr:ATP-dependent DNA helicase PIF1-like [Pisum sativum]
MEEDYQIINNVVELNLTNMLLKDLNELLNLHGKKIEDYDLPSLPPNTIDRDAIPSIIQEELAVDIPNQDIEYVAKLNNDQMIAFKTIMNVIAQKHTTASSGIARTLLPGGRTAHSRFKIPIDIQPSSIYGIQKQKDIANLIRVATAIIWDETPMTNKNYLEALDRSLQDICSNNAQFGGKVLIMGGDFCQVLPVLRKGTKAQMISACIIQSHLWNHTKILHLRQNMRLLHDQEFAEFLIRIGDGVEPTKPDDRVHH